MIVLASDPAWAKPGSACAEFRNGALHSTWFWDWRNPGVHSSAVALAECKTLVVEKPQKDARTRHVQESYDKLVAAYELTIEKYNTHGTHVRRLTPNQWKGSQPKPQHHLTIWEELTPEERAILPADCESRIVRACERGALNRWAKPGAYYYGSWKGHNTLDAVGLGLFHLGRIGK